MKVEVFSLGPIGTNAYLITNNEDTQGVIIDPGMNPEPLLERIEAIDIQAILLTHAHFDHIGGLEKVRKATNAPVYIHPVEQEWLEKPELNGSGLWKELTGEIKASPAEHELQHGDSLTLLSMHFDVLHTPGHSPGSLSFYTKGHCFSGDTLFADSIGRTDLPGGSYDTLVHSIHTHLFHLPDDTIIYPGHGPTTTIRKEKTDNVYVGMH